MRIGIVGAGASGLRAAMLLERAGHEVEIYEARDRIGGRIYTFRQGDVAFDIGGEWLDSDHYRTLQLLRDLGIEPEKSNIYPGRVIYDDQETSEDNLWPDALEDELRVEALAKEICRNLNTIPWKNKAYAELDRASLLDFLEQNAPTPRGLWWNIATKRSDEGDDPDRIGLLGWLCGYLHYMERDGESMSAYRVPGGMDRLTSSMASRLKSSIHLNMPVQRIEQEDGQVFLSFERDRVGFDRIIVTAPPQPLEHIAFEPALSREKRCAIEASRMSRAIKIAWQFERPWWRDSGWNGRLLTNSPLQQLWEGTRAEQPVLTAYIGGDESRRWMALPDPVEEGLKELEKLDPNARELFVRGWVYDWAEDEWARGAFSHLPPGFVLEHMEHLAPAEGLVHFAGEHTALWIGFIEGALESAERVVGEIERYA